MARKALLAMGSSDQEGTTGEKSSGHEGTTADEE